MSYTTVYLHEMGGVRPPVINLKQSHYIIGNNYVHHPIQVFMAIYWTFLPRNNVAEFNAINAPLPSRIRCLISSVGTALTNRTTTNR